VKKIAHQVVNMQKKKLVKKIAHQNASVVNPVSGNHAHVPWLLEEVHKMMGGVLKVMGMGQLTQGDGWGTQYDKRGS